MFKNQTFQRPNLGGFTMIIKLIITICLITTGTWNQNGELQINNFEKRNILNLKGKEQKCAENSTKIQSITKI